MTSFDQLHTHIAFRSAFVVAALMLLTGCGMEGGRPQAGFAPPPPPPPMVIAQADSVPSHGAIFQVKAGYAGLHQGNRARSVGDLITVILTETITTSKSTSASTDRDGSFGITPPASGPLNFLNPNALKAAANGTFSGSGDAAQQSRLNGAVAVTIAAVHGNGTATVVGEKQMSLSQGEEWIQFAGTVRLADVSSDNQLASSQVANARIIYSGNGAIQKASRPGWLSRFFNIVSPF